jgi:hypothetical protein
LFINTYKMLQHINGGRADGTLERRFQTYLRPDLLVLDSTSATSGAASYLPATVHLRSGPICSATPCWPRRAWIASPTRPTSWSSPAPASEPTDPTVHKRRCLSNHQTHPDRPVPSTVSIVGVSLPSSLPVDHLGRKPVDPCRAKIDSSGCFPRTLRGPVEESSPTLSDGVSWGSLV